LVMQHNYVNQNKLMNRSCGIYVDGMMATRQWLSTHTIR